MSKKQYIQMFALILTLGLMCAFVVAAEAGAAQIPVWILVINALQILATGLCCAAVFLLGFWAFEWWEKHPSFGGFETNFRLFLYKRRMALAQKNAVQIAPALQYFLYCVLRRNKDSLGIDPGPHCGSLSPNGRAATFRNGAAFYCFELVLPSAPEMDIALIRQLANQFIFAELSNYGIANLPSFFTVSNGKTCPSVYLGRLDYDDVRHILIFELLFVCSDQAANALVMAWERDKPKTAQPELEVFDDEI